MTESQCMTKVKENVHIQEEKGESGFVRDDKVFRK